MQPFIFLTEFDLIDRSGASIKRIIELSKVINGASNGPVYIASLLMDNNVPRSIKIEDKFPIFQIGEFKKLNKNFFEKKYLLHKRKFEELKLIVKYSKEINKKPVFIVYNHFSSFLDNIVFVKYLKNEGFKIIVEKNERALGIALIRTAPSGIKGIVFRIFQFIEIINGLLIDNYLNAFNGYLIINENYRNFILNKVSNKPIIKIPILYPNIRNSNKLENKSGKNILLIGYFGTINFKRDKIDTILKALALLKDIYNIHNVKFTIGGKVSKHEEVKLKERIKQLDLQLSVDYLGYLDYDELITQLENQDVLLALRNNNLQGKYSFATKIAMYMHMGKIPLVSNVSDNHLYITNGENGFILSETKADSLANLLLEIRLMQSTTLHNISRKAKITAQEYFNYKSYIKDFNALLSEL